MYDELIKSMQCIPGAYESTGIAFWDDDHISKSMLEAHLAPEGEGASRNHAFIGESAEWIESLPLEGKRLLDLGCGPGLYTERLCRDGFEVTGVDLSRRSIAYARESAGRAGLDIDYRCQDYLSLDFQEEYDLAMLIYCDFGVLPPHDREALLERVFAALKPGGLFVVDVFTRNHYSDFAEGMEASFEDVGFWRDEPYLCIKRNIRYEGANYLERYTVVTEGGCETYNLWNHAFNPMELSRELESAGFQGVAFFGDAAGNELSAESTTLCAMARKACAEEGGPCSG